MRIEDMKNWTVDQLKKEVVRLADGIEAEGEYDISNNYLRMHGIPMVRRVAGRRGVRKHER